VTVLDAGFDDPACAGGPAAVDWWGEVLQRVADGEVRLVLAAPDGAEAVLVSGSWLDRLERRARAGSAAVRLSGRELEVLLLIDAGLTATAVAGRLGLAVNTVHQHLTMVRRTLGVRSTSEAVAAARKAGLIPDANPYRSTTHVDTADGADHGTRGTPHR
jgi:DNA-binding CsgD family transcriptional regulator